MKKPPRVVLDTNVFISSFVLRKKTFQIVKAWQNDQFLWILSPEIHQEYLAVISKPKFHQTQEEITAISSFLEALIDKKIIVKVIPSVKLNIINEDPKDNIFLECAVVGKADYILSGDRHLLDLKRYQEILVLSPRSFLELLQPKKRIQLELDSVLKELWDSDKDAAYDEV